METFMTLLAQDTATPEEFVRAFAVEFDTPNVRRALLLCETHVLTWERVTALFARSLTTGLESAR